MKNIGIIDVDGHNFPNLALMKISAYHKSIGDNVGWVDIGNYDKTYMSKVFTFTPAHVHGFGDYGEVIMGGTGFGDHSVLPDHIEHIMPDYSIYGIKDIAYGFLTRGCPNKCSWCVVPKKEGNIRANADITEFWNGQKYAVLLDNNVLAHEHGLKQIEKMAKLGVKIDFNQGLDARLIDDTIAKLLASAKWYRPIRLACDTKSQMPYIEKAVGLLRKHNATPQNYFIYVLVKDIEDALERVEFLKGLNLDPFAQPYRDFENNISPTKEQKQFARWVNHKAIFKSVEFKNYKP